MPNTTVEIGQFTGFILDSATQGILDTDVLDGDIAYTQIPQGVFAVSTTRGRDKDLERTSAGQVSVGLRNNDTYFDPVLGAFAEFTKPRLPVRVFTDGSAVFTGYVDDWNFDYEPGGIGEASFNGSDGFSRFARQVNAGGSAVEEATGARLGRVLDQATLNYLGGRDIDTGDSTLAAGDLGTDSALDYMINIVEESEQGLLFMAKDGTFTFRSRLVSQVGSAVKFADDGSGVPFSEVGLSYGSEDLVNQAIVTGPNGTAVTNDATSQVVYGITSRTVDSQLSTLAAQQSIADYIVGRYSEPELRVESVGINLQALSSGQVSQVLGLEIGDRVVVEFTPGSAGSAVAFQNRVIGISHDAQVDAHFMTFNLEKLEFTFFVLDDLAFGKLDEADVVLGF